MADIAIAAVVRKSVDILGNLLDDEGTHWYWLRGDIGWIEAEMRQIQSLLRDAEGIQDNHKGVATLIARIRDLGFYVEDIIDTFFPKLASKRSKKSPGFLSTKVSWKTISFTSILHKFGMEIARSKKSIESINTAWVTYGSVGNDSREEE